MMRKYLSLFVAILGGMIMVSSSAYAANAVNWKAGRIIDDSVFFRDNTMSVNDIQNFLNTQVPSCDTAGQKMYSSSLTRAQYGASKGYPAPYVCLKNYQENPTTHETNLATAGSVAGGWSAAQIIKYAADTYGVNPKVLIILLQKEQSLVTDDWPWPSQYRSATGYGCPDTAPCDAEYYGFYNQVTNAAAAFKRYAANPQNYRYKAYQNNDILYNPSSSCGSSSVYLQNQATTGLYIYTPYQPNQAALNNLYGTGDSCSAYGNRNFWRIFTDWFGSTVVPESTQYIPDGIYKITNPISGKNLDVVLGGTSSGTRVWLYDSNTTDAQKWQISRDEQGFYSIKNVSSGKYLDVIGASTSMGTGVQIWDGNNSCAQKWAAVSSIKGGFSLLNVCSGYALDLINGSTTSGTKLQTWENNLSDAQRWNLVSLEAPVINDGLYRINNPSGLSLGAAATASSSGNILMQIQTSADADSQYWQISRQTDGSYVIRNPLSNKVIDVINAAISDGTGLQIFSHNNTCAQRWSIVKEDDSTYNILSACSGKVIDVLNGQTSVDKTPVQLWEANDTPAQSWQFLPLAEVPAGSYSLLTQSKRAIDITGGNISDGTPIQIWSTNKSQAQLWTITPLEDGTFSIKNTGTNKYLDVTGGKIASETKMQVWNSNDTCAQRWKIAKNSDSTYGISSACSDTLVLDVTGGSIYTNGTRLQLYSSNKSTPQKWSFGFPW